jgi:hypothetical protein
MNAPGCEQVTEASLASTRARTHRLHLGMAIACAAIAFGGFAPTYWVPVLSGRPAVAPIVHLHGLLFSTWVLFFVLQSWLAASGRVARHRSLGLLGIALATAMLIIGFAAQAHSLRLGIAAGLEEENRAFSIVPITFVLFFAGSVAFAIANIARPEVHRRLMLVATTAILPPAIARVFALATSVPLVAGHPPPLVFSLAPSFAANLVLLAAMIFDRRINGRWSRTYLASGACLLLLEIVRIPVARTAAWHAVTDGLLALSA